MTKCTYVRKTKEGYERGFIEETFEGGRHYKPVATHDSLDDALGANSMALTGMPRIGTSYSPRTPWVLE